MERKPVAGAYGAQGRARRWAREIALAVVLTIAAAAFITLAFLRSSSAPEVPPSFETARKPAAN